jgi:hypothetical protein
MVVAGVLCFLVRSMIMATAPRTFVILAGCFIVFAAVYVAALLLLRVVTDEEREKVRRGVQRIQQLVYG